MTRCADTCSAGAFLVLSPVRWDAPWQRPQEIFSRLAPTHDVLYVESPLFLDDVARPTLECSVPVDGILRVVPRLPAIYAALEEVALLATRTLLLELLDSDESCGSRFARPVHWYCTAAPAPVMLQALGASAVVYDRGCDPRGAGPVDGMDIEHPAENTSRHEQRCCAEQLLLAQADVVLSTSGLLREVTQACWERITNEVLRLAARPARHLN